MRRLTILFIIIIAVGSCTSLQRPTTLSQVKSELECVQYKEGMAWNQVSQAMGAPDIAPITQPGTDLSNNTRIYKDKIIILYIGPTEIDEEGKVRFQEAVTNIEFCKKK